MADLAVGDERDPGRDRHLPAMLLAIPLYHYSIFDMGLALVAFIARADGDGLGAGAGDLRRHPAPRHGRREPGLDRDLRDRAAELRLLPADDSAGMAAPGRLGAALDACLRGHARGAVRAHFPHRLFPLRDRARSRLSRDRRGDLLYRLPQRTTAAARCCRWASDYGEQRRQNRVENPAAGFGRGEPFAVERQEPALDQPRPAAARTASRHPHRPALRGAAARRPRRAAAPS